MFTFLLFAALGAYLSQRVSTIRDGEIVSVSVDYQRIVADFVALFAFVASLWNWSVSTGRNARLYFDGAIAPWLAERGISVRLPEIDLPRLDAIEPNRSRG